MKTAIYKTLKFNNYNLHYWVSGNSKGETIIFIHPAFCDHNCFNRQLDFFAKNYNIITIDMMGHGLLKPSKTKDKIDKTTDHLLKIISNENIEKAHLVGVSLGSLMAQHFAISHPNNTISVTVVGGYNINTKNHEVNKAQQKEGLKWMIKALFSMNSFHKYVASITVLNEDSKAEVYKIAKGFSRKSFLYMQGVKNIIAYRKNAKITCPLNIITGQKDIDLTHRMSKLFHESIPQSQFHIIENAGHCANMDNAEEFNRVLAYFLRNK